MIKEWLGEKICVITQDGKFPIIQEGFIDFSTWFKTSVKEGDELWSFCSPPASWRCLAGRSGVCIIRNGEIIEAKCDMMS